MSFQTTKQEGNLDERKVIPPKKKLLLIPDNPITNTITAYDKLIISDNTIRFCNIKSNEHFLLCIKPKYLESTPSIELKDYDTLHVQPETLIHFLIHTIGTCLDIWNHIFPEPKEICTSLTNQLNQSIENYGIHTDLTENGWSFQYNKRAITFEEVIRAFPTATPFPQKETNFLLQI